MIQPSSPSLSPMSTSSDDGSSCVIQLSSSSFSSFPTKERPRRREMSPGVRMERIAKPFLHAVDLLVLFLVIEWVSWWSLLSHGRATPQSTAPLILPSRGALTETYVDEFLSSFPNSAENNCESTLHDHEVTFSLTLALTSERQLSAVGHHCKRWGIGAPISVAVWTCLSAEEILDMLLSMESNKYCHRDQLIITTIWPPLSSSAVNSRNGTQIGGGNVTMPRPCSRTPPPHINRLRNLAIQAAAKTTTHVVPLDINMWPASDLFDILNAPRAIKALARDPQLALVIPAFETDQEVLCQGINKSKSTKSPNMARTTCPYHNFIPRSYDDLLMRIADGKVVPLNSLDYDRQGGTNYPEWIVQSTGHLRNISCVSSDSYRPVVAVRNCNGLPPFPQRTGHRRNGQAMQRIDDYSLPPEHGDNVATWTVHLKRMGYSFQQLGRAFVVSLTNGENKSKKIKSSTRPSSKLKHGSSSFVTDFYQWLEATVPDRSVVKVCDKVNLDRDGFTSERYSTY